MVVGSPLNEPRACLSVPTATTMSPLPERMAFAACWIVAAPVAHALNTWMNGSAAEADQTGEGIGPDPPAPAEGALDVVPRHTCVGQRQLYGIGGHLVRGLVAVPTEGVQADTDDRDVVHSALLTVLRADGREGESHDLVAVVVDIERDDSEHDLHTEVELLGIALVSRDSTRTTSSSCTSPTPKGSKD